jgi:OmcA/MtrC family decaheme c-type cytochrome
MSRFHRSYFTAPLLILVLLTIPVLAQVASQAAKDYGFTKHDLAYYLDDYLVNFIRPGLVLKITSASIQNQTISVRFTVTDPKGLPLDRDGVNTPGPVSTSFIAAYIPSGQTLYTAYTTRAQTSPITKQTAVQAGTDSGGTYTRNADGDYTYTFKTTVPSNYDPAATHSIGIYATRNLGEWSLPSNYADVVYNFVPNGSAVKNVRDIAKTATCNHCHDPLSAHGGARRSVELCVLCHQPQTVDPDTGNSVDMAVMVHKIHMGDQLPSVIAGTPYQIIGYNQSVADYSTVAFPDNPERCEACHQGATQSSVYLTKPSRRACGACHDDVNFATGLNHVNLPQVSDNLCATCHIPQGELEFDASIKGAHTIPQFSTQMAGNVGTLVKVDNAAPGKPVTVTFTLKDKQGNNVDVSKIDSLSLVVAGPTTDYTWYLSESAKTATASGSSWIYTFKGALPADAKGSYAVMMEGYKTYTLNPGTTQAITGIRDAVNNAVLYFSADGSTVVKRRAVVDMARCNNCHGTLMLHGTFRRGVEGCVFCHNPLKDDATYRAAKDLPTESINFKTMIHKIHTGEELTTTFTIIGRNGSVNNFNEVRYPGDRRDCLQCHSTGTYNLPLPETNISQKAPRDYINPLPPVSGACLSCHTTKAIAAHAAVMTSPVLGESCDACHGPNANASVDKVHAR